jgi:hypothetical protein
MLISTDPDPNPTCESESILRTGLNLQLLQHFLF